MKSIALLSTVAFALLSGCAATSSESSTDDNNLTNRPEIRLEQSSEASSVQAKLHALLDAFKGEADLGITTDGGTAFQGATFTLTGAPESGVSRSVTCTSSSMELVGPGGSGFTHRDFFQCNLVGFDPMRGGGLLPQVFVPFEGDEALAGKLYKLMEKGKEKGGLGVERTASDENPPCCDMPTHSTYELGDANATLSCTMHGGGFTGALHAECTYKRAIRPNE